jgi:hypothetical protein
LRERFGSIVEGIAGAIIGGAILALIIYLVTADSHVQVADWILVAGGLGVLIVGGEVAFLGAEGGGAIDPESEAELQEVNEKYTATSAYAAHFRNTLASLLTGKLIISGDVEAWDEEVERLLCESPRQIIEEQTGHEPAISLWGEKTDPSSGETRFEILLDANHTGNQVRKFASLKVNEDESWLHHTATRQRGNPEASPIASRNLSDSADGYDDLKMFKSMEYKEIRVFAIELDGRCLRWVALTKDGFSATEDFFFLLLWSIFAAARSI